MDDELMSCRKAHELFLRTTHWGRVQHVAQALGVDERHLATILAEHQLMLVRSSRPTQRALLQSVR